MTISSSTGGPDGISEEPPSDSHVSIITEILGSHPPTSIAGVTSIRAARSIMGDHLDEVLSHPSFRLGLSWALQHLATGDPYQAALAIVAHIPAYQAGKVALAQVEASARGNALLERDRRHPPMRRPIEWGSAVCEESLMRLVSGQLSDLTDRLPRWCYPSPAGRELVVAAWCLVHLRCYRLGVPAETYLSRVVGRATETARKKWWPADVAPLLPGISSGRMSALRRLTIGTPSGLGYLPAWYRRAPASPARLSSWAWALVQCDPERGPLPDRTCVVGRVRAHSARQPDTLADLDLIGRSRAVLGIAG